MKLAGISQERNVSKIVFFLLEFLFQVISNGQLHKHVSATEVPPREYEPVLWTAAKVIFSSCRLFPHLWTNCYRGSRCTLLVNFQIFADVQKHPGQEDTSSVPCSYSS